MNLRARRFILFWRTQGTRAVLRLVRVKLGDGIAGRRVFNDIVGRDAEVGVVRAPVAVSRLAAERFSALSPLPAYLIPAGSLPRITLVTDSIGKSSLFGGVGTALILAAQLANRVNANLRIVTRTEKASPGNAQLILSAYGIRLKHEMQFAFAPSHDLSSDGPAERLDVQPGESFLTTSWWTTAATLRSVAPSSVIYLLQEDERMFYPFGEDRLHCEEIMRRRDIRFVVNTQLLFDHLVGSGLDNLATHGQWFEPAFPPSLFRPRERASTKRRLFFYARPNNSRNLFYVGLAALDRAVNQGVLDLKEWDVYLVGKDIPKLKFGDGYEAYRVEGLDWQAYAELVGTIDLGLSLMYTPHPSYPPLDLAASGAVVITNKFGNKQNLTSYSENIICADLDIDALVAALGQGIALAQDDDRRRRNFARNGIGTDWDKSFEEILQSLTVAR